MQKTALKVLILLLCAGIGNSSYAQTAATINKKQFQRKHYKEYEQY
ncbi:hypothetical protein [Pedobacter frigidisoli]|nr:hypothetical protein [Pedobacter frigidisoli]